MAVVGESCEAMNWILQLCEYAYPEPASTPGQPVPVPQLKPGGDKVAAPYCSDRENQRSECCSYHE